MVIAHLLTHFTYGGIETMLVDIVNEQVKHAEIHIIALNDANVIQIISKIDKRVNIHNCGRKLGSINPLPFLRLNYILYKISPDILHVHFEKLYRFIYWRGLKVRTVHNTGYNVSESKHYDACFAISKSVQEEWSRQGVNIILVENGINCGAIKPRQSTLPHKDVYELIQVSRLLVSQKGQDILIEAIDRLVKEGYTNFMLSFAGDGPDRSRLESLVNQKNLVQHVRFLGQRDRDWIYNNLCNYDCFIQPSRFEGFGLTVAEACAAKIPVLVSDNEGPLEILDGGKLGMTFKNMDIKDLTNKLKVIISGQYDYTQIIAAYGNTLKRYDVKRTARVYLKEYDRLLDKNVK